MFFKGAIMPGEHPLATIQKLDPQFMERVSELDKMVFSDGALPKKIKLLMAMAFDAANGATEGVKALARASVQAGATKEEIAETLRVACQLSGIGSLYTASNALKELLQ
jgi:alkylhydroperoxidase/carboxymuconolactone decarboxylase family protein YurZ